MTFDVKTVSADYDPKIIYHSLYISLLDWTWLVHFHFEVIWSKVKVRVTLNVKMFSTEYLVNYLSLCSHISQDDWS